LSELPNSPTIAGVPAARTDLKCRSGRLRVALGIQAPQQECGRTPAMRPTLGGPAATKQAVVVTPSTGHGPLRMAEMTMDSVAIQRPLPAPHNVPRPTRLQTASKRRVEGIPQLGNGPSCPLSSSPRQPDACIRGPHWKSMGAATASLPVTRGGSAAGASRGCRPCSGGPWPPRRIGRPAFLRSLHIGRAVGRQDREACGPGCLAMVSRILG
jgi:hypothetical protein